MRVRFMVSHPANNRPKIKMAKVDGCTFFKRESGWKHVDKSCTQITHWIWQMTLLIGQCTLIRKDGAWAHRNGNCKMANLYLEVQEKGAEKMREQIEKEHDARIAPLLKQMVENAADADSEADVNARSLIKAVGEEKARLLQLIEQVKKEKPACVLEPDDTPETVGGCGFFVAGDVFKHRCVEDDCGNPTSRCKKHEHYEDRGGVKIRLTREPGWQVEEFVKKANESLGQALLPLVPPDARKHILVEV